MQLYIDEADVDPGGILRLEGWVVCLVQIESVEAFIDGGRIGKAEFGRARSRYRKSCTRITRIRGFPASGSSPMSARTVPAGKRSRSGRPRAPASPRKRRPRWKFREQLSRHGDTPDPGFHYHCDDITLTDRRADRAQGVGRLPVAGQRLSRCSSTAKKIGQAELGLERPDVGNLFPGLPHARQTGLRV